MPYISPTSRDKFTEILKQIRELGELPAGELNYLITSIIDCQYSNVERFNKEMFKINYDKINEIMGVLTCVKEEFYRRIVVPYEAVKCRTNGDVYYS